MDTLEFLPGGIPIEWFLREHWQKRPLLITGAFPDFESPIAPEDLAGIALEEDADSRLVLEHGGDYPWQLLHGPFLEDDFANLPESHWTLLVQDVDRWVPEMRELLDRFLFVPAWRLDDVMVSYAPDGGSVGAHVDEYDVFLIQALGQREWRIGTTPIERVTCVPDLDVSMLADFEPDEVWTLNPGDMLYLPPRVGHHGIARGDCMTFSVGYRAPGYEDILAAVLGRATEEAVQVPRYADPNRVPPQHPGRIGLAEIGRLREVVQDLLNDERIARWLGMLVTEPRRGEGPCPSDRVWTGEAVSRAVLSGSELVRVAPNRVAFVEYDDGHVDLFMQGEAFALDANLAPAAALLAGRDVLNADALAGLLGNEVTQGLLARLVNAGHLEVQGEA